MVTQSLATFLSDWHMDKFCLNLLFILHSVNYRCIKAENLLNYQDTVEDPLNLSKLELKLISLLP